MGIVIPRPPIRAKESRTIRQRLARHAELTERYKAEGLSPAAASAKAYQDITGKASIAPAD